MKHKVFSTEEPNSDSKPGFKNVKCGWIALVFILKAPTDLRYQATTYWRPNYSNSTDYRIEDERPILVKGFCGFVAVRELPVSDTLAKLVAEALNGNHDARGDW